MSDNRTHQPTAKRRQQARKEGRVAASHLVGGALSWLVLAALVLYSAAWLISLLRSESGRNISLPTSAEGLRDFVFAILVKVNAYMLIPLGVILGIAILSRLSQVGFLWVPSRVLPDMSRLNPGPQLTMLLSIDKVFQAGRGLLLIICALALIGWGIVFQQDQLMQLLLTSEGAELKALHLLANWGLKLGGVLAFFALIDYASNWYRFESNLMMSQEEVRAEVKAVEGNTQVASERKAMHRTMTSSRQQPSSALSGNH